MSSGADAGVRARALIGVGRYAEAAAAAREGLAAEPDHPGLALLLALALGASGDADGARPVVERAVALAPGDARAHRTFGWVAHTQGRHREAADHLARALALDPHDPEAHVMRAEAVLKQAQRSRLPTRRRTGLLVEADRHAGEAVRLAPARPGGHLMHGKVAATRADAPAAEAWARRALAVEPDHPVGHQLLGLAAQLRGETRAAADHFVAAGRLDPRSDASMRMLRSVRAVPARGAAISVAARLIVVCGLVVGGAGLAVAVACLGALVLYRWAVAPWQARRGMSDDARRALTRDRAVRRRRPWR